MAEETITMLYLVIVLGLGNCKYTGVLAKLL